MENQILVLKRKPAGLPVVEDFELIEEAMPANQDGELLLKSIYISVDPYLRGKISGRRKPAFEIGQPMDSKIIAEVLSSKHPNFATGSHVIGIMDWKKYQVSDGTGLAVINMEAASLTANLGVLGSTGLSAYFALLDIGKPKAGETLVVSGAGGAVGSIAGQIGKILGCRVIGIVGTDQKAALIKDVFGFDGAINYNTTQDLKSDLAAICPDGVDIYFDNIGGPVSDAVISRMNNYGRIPLCGSISSYNDTEEQKGPRLLPLIVFKFLTVQGFLISDFAPRFPEGIEQLTSWLKDGKLKYTETIIDGFGRLPEAFIGLFEGKNEGKMIVRA